MDRTDADICQCPKQGLINGLSRRLPVVIARGTPSTLASQHSPIAEDSFPNGHGPNTGGRWRQWLLLVQESSRLPAPSFRLRCGHSLESVGPNLCLAKHQPPAPWAGESGDTRQSTCESKRHALAQAW